MQTKLERGYIGPHVSDRGPWLDGMLEEHAQDHRIPQDGVAEGVAKDLPDGSQVLEVACPGRATLRWSCASFGRYHIVGLDINSETFVHMANDNARTARYRSGISTGQCVVDAVRLQLFRFCLLPRCLRKTCSELVKAISEMHRAVETGREKPSIVDLRKDVPASEIDAAVAEMRLGRESTPHWTR